MTQPIHPIPVRKIIPINIMALLAASLPYYAKIDENYPFREELKNCVKRIVDAADAKRANDIVAVHVGDKTIITDWFVFMSGTSPIHVKALSDEIEDCAAEMGLPMRRREGYSEGRWIVLDFAGILVHIFHPEEREYYNVERLWMDATTEIIRPEK